MAAKMPMMAITTNNSIRVNPCFFRLGCLRILLLLHSYEAVQLMFACLQFATVVSQSYFCSQPFARNSAIAQARFLERCHSMIRDATLQRASRLRPCQYNLGWWWD